MSGIDREIAILIGDDASIFVGPSARGIAFIAHIDGCRDASLPCDDTPMDFGRRPKPQLCIDELRAIVDGNLAPRVIFTAR